MNDAPSLRDYQVADLALYIANPRFLNLSDPGTGKTPSVCVYAYWIWKELGGRTVWAMPKSLLKKNKRELHTFTPFTDEDVVIVDGTPKQRDEQIKSDAKVLLMGFSRWAEDWRTILKAHPDVTSLLVDEMHLGYKRNSSARTQELFKSMRRLDRFLGMTGTLIDGDLGTAYPAMHVVEPRYYYNYTAFEAQHTVKDVNGKIISWTNHEKIRTILGRHAARHTFSEVFGEANMVIQTEPAEMSPQQFAAYREFEENGLIELLEKFILGGNEGVNIIRCLQIMQCPEVLDLNVPVGKDENIRIHLEDAIQRGETMLVTGRFPAELDRIHKTIQSQGHDAGIIHGGVSTKHRDEYDQAFRAGEIKFMVGSPPTLGVGYNWEMLDHIVHSSLTYLDSDFTQANRRGVRGVRATPLRVTVLSYENSIDQMLFAMLRRKSREAHKVDPSYPIIDLFNTSPETDRKVEEMVENSIHALRMNVAAQ